MFSSSEDRERAQKIAENSRTSQFKTLVKQKLSSMKLSSNEKDIDDALNLHKPLRYKDAHTTATHAVAHLVEKGLTSTVENAKKRGREEDQQEDMEEEDFTFPGPPPGIPPQDSWTSNNKKRRTETGAASEPPSVPPIVTHSSLSLSSSSSSSSHKDETIPSDVFDMMEKRPENFVAKILMALKLPANNTMSSLLNNLIISLHNRNGGNALTPAERKKLGMSVCEYLYATRYRATDVNAATASAKKTIHELSNQVLTSNRNPSHEEVEKLFSSSDSLFECWSHLHSMVQSRRSTTHNLDATLRKKHEDSVSNITSERSRMQNVVKESEATIQKSKLRMHSLDMFLDKYVQDQKDENQVEMEEEETEKAKHTQLSEKKIEIGTVVLSPYKRKSAFYRGHVQAINPDGTLRIKYDDGDLDRSIPAHMVHIEGSAPAPKLKPRSTTSIMNFLDQAKDDPKLSDTLDLRRKLNSKIRSQKCRISHAKLMLRTSLLTAVF